MNEDPPSAIEAFLDEAIRCGEVLKEVLILYVINLYEELLIWPDKLFVNWQAMYR